MDDLQLRCQFIELRFLHIQTHDASKRYLEMSRGLVLIELLEFHCEFQIESLIELKKNKTALSDSQKRKIFRDAS